MFYFISTNVFYKYRIGDIMAAYSEKHLFYLFLLMFYNEESIIWHNFNQESMESKL